LIFIKRRNNNYTNPNPYPYTNSFDSSNLELVYPEKNENFRKSFLTNNETNNASLSYYKEIPDEYTYINERENEKEQNKAPILLFFNSSSNYSNHSNYTANAFEDYYLQQQPNSIISIIGTNLLSNINSSTFLLNETEKEQKDLKAISTICLIQGAFMIHSDISIYAVASLVSLYTYVSIKELFSSLTIKKRLLLYLLGYIFPFAIGLFSVLSNKIDKNVYWCWINANEKSFIYFNYSLVWFFIFFNFVISYKTLRFQDSAYWNQDQAKNNKLYGKKLIVYPLISIVFWLIYTINRILDYLHDSKYAFSVFIIYLNNVEAIIYASISLYGIRIHKKLRKLFFQVFKSFKKNGEEMDRTSEIKYDDLLNETNLTHNKTDIIEDRLMSSPRDSKYSRK